MAKKKIKTLSTDELPSMMSTLGQETDRGCVLVAHAFLDSAIETRLREYFSLQSDAEKKTINDLFTPRSTLSTFWSKVTLAHVIGVVDRSAYKALACMNNIRNYFAHHPGSVCFDADVDDLVKHASEAYRGTLTPFMDHLEKYAHAFHGSKEHPFSKERLRFMIAATSLYSVLEMHRVFTGNIDPKYNTGKILEDRLAGRISNEAFSEFLARSGHTGSTTIIRPI